MTLQMLHRPAPIHPAEKSTPTRAAPAYPNPNPASPLVHAIGSVDHSARWPSTQTDIRTFALTRHTFAANNNQDFVHSRVLTQNPALRWQRGRNEENHCACAIPSAMSSLSSIDPTSVRQNNSSFVRNLQIRPCSPPTSRTPLAIQQSSVAAESVAIPRVESIQLTTRSLCWPHPCSTLQPLHHWP